MLRLQDKYPYWYKIIFRDPQGILTNYKTQKGKRKNSVKLMLEFPPHGQDVETETILAEKKKKKKKRLERKEMK